ncbi:cell wall hydrolase [Clostridium sp.]|uniref:cell wall hydrolase n=1 Tax=Clostridium sp. TaxID=1506 RepID=UPI002FCA11C6
MTLSFSGNIIEVSALGLQGSTTSCLVSTTDADNAKSDYNTRFIDISDGSVVEVFNHNDKMIYLTEEDVFLMSQIVFAESKGEPYEGKVAVASVILNRVLDPAFPNTIADVVFQTNAFSCVVDGVISVTPNQECFNAVYEAIKGNDPTNEALFFYNPAIATCSWMHDIEKTDSRAIGQHLFFKA